MSGFTKLIGSIKRSPMLVPSVQTGVLMGVGDFISQTVVEKTKPTEVDPMRMAKFGFIGLAFCGPVLSTWYGFLERNVKIKSPKLLAAAAKVAPDQLIFTPILFVFLLGLISFSKGNNFDEVQKDVKKSYPDVLKTNYFLWPAAQMINFSVVPPSKRVLYVQCIAIFWNTFLSWKTNQK
ncbi:Protein SYM1 [Orchesella cincta]|uniref:Mitochondrial inner membrane protein Mpv17 n=1 Tax=Orchesella cincta TaxID=48709 RepID=A0A1D2N3N8_ORCCI|nr:Protein SYM1 [Orchesella cincta]